MAPAFPTVTSENRMSRPRSKGHQNHRLDWCSPQNGVVPQREPRGLIRKDHDRRTFSRPTGLVRLDGEERFWGSACRLDHTGPHRVWSSPIGVTARADRTPSPKLQESRPPTRSGLMSATLVMPEPWFHGPLGELLARTYDVCTFSCSFTPRGRLAVLKLVLFRVSCRGGTRST